VDILTGFAGTATSRTDYLYGCVRVLLEAGDKDSKPVSDYFDEQRLREASGAIPFPTAISGGPHDAPPSRDPR